METLGIHHLGLNVSDLNATTAFFVDCLGWSLIKEVPDYPSNFVSNGEAVFTLWQASPNASQFDRKGQVGLHHVAIRVSDEQALSEIFNRFSNYSGVSVEFSPLQKDVQAFHFKGGQCTKTGTWGIFLAIKTSIIFQKYAASPSGSSSVQIILKGMFSLHWMPVRTTPSWIDRSRRGARRR